MALICTLQSAKLKYYQPAVDDQEVDQLVQQRVDTFWKAIEGGMSKRGQVSLCSTLKRTFAGCYPSDIRDVLGEATKEVLVSCWRGPSLRPFLLPRPLIVYHRRRYHGSNGQSR